MSTDDIGTGQVHNFFIDFVRMEPFWAGAMDQTVGNDLTQLILDFVPGLQWVCEPFGLEFHIFVDVLYIEIRVSLGFGAIVISDLDPGQNLIPLVLDITDIHGVP